MSENETNPPRQPANPDAEPSHPTAELPRAPREQSDSSDPTAPIPAPAAPTPAAPASGAPADHAAPAMADHAAPAMADHAAPAPAAGAPASGASADHAAPAPASGAPAASAPIPSGHGAPSHGAPSHGASDHGTADDGASGHGAPSHGAPSHGASDHGTFGHGVSGPGVSSQGVAGPYAPPSPWHPAAAQQPAWPGNTGYGAPAAAPPHGYAEHAAGAGPVPGQPQSGVPMHGGPGDVPPGQPPIWAQPPGAHARPPRSGRFGKAVLLGVVGLVLMAGSGIAGGAVALAVNDGGQTVNKTFEAAPVINQADLPNIAKQVQNSVVSISTDNAGGSGVVLSDDGYILTNNHVVQGARSLRVAFADGKTATAEVVGTDPRTDLAVIKADGVSGLEEAKFGDSDAIQVGDTVLAIGSPLGLEGSVTSGIVSATDRTIRTGDEQPQNPFAPQQQTQVSSISGLLQTDAAINPGNSGGALVNTRGEVIGINTAIATSGQSTGNIGVGFAIPSNKAKEVADALRNGQKVSHPSLGVSVQTADGGGAVVSNVVENSPAAKVGLQRGDVIIKFGDKAISDSDDLVGAVQSGKVGDQVTLTYTRNGEQRTATATLAEAS